MDNDKLIAAVRTRPFLWDKADKNRFNRHTIAAAWTSIAKEVGGGVTAADCKTRWTSLRDYFLRKHKETRGTTSGPAASKKKKWPLYESMLFLLPATGLAARSLPEAHEDSSSCGYTDNEQFQIILPTSPLSIKSEESSPSASRKPVQAQKRKAARTPEISAVDRAEVSKASKEPEKRQADENEVPKASKEPEKRQADENELFFRSLLPSLNKLDEVDTMQFRLEVQQLALDYLRRARDKRATAASPPGSSQASSAGPTAGHQRSQFNDD